jgi:uncharacterized membrane protein
MHHAVAILIAFSSSVRINRSAMQVFAVLSDFEQYLAQWAEGPMGATKLTPGETRVGTQFMVTAKIGPFRVRSAYEVVGWEPPERLQGRGTAGPVRFEEEYRLATNNGVTELQQSIRAWPRGPFRLVEGLVERQLRRLISDDLERLRRLVESMPA